MAVTTFAHMLNYPVRPKIRIENCLWMSKIPSVNRNRVRAPDATMPEHRSLSTVCNRLVHGVSLRILCSLHAQQEITIN